jgi:RNA polymerase sigma-70 factor (ECF subfamily)
MLGRAHVGPAEAANAAYQELLQLYGGAVRRYLLGAVRDAEVAEELAQEFALRFVRGDFRRADPERGRFRDYLKTALIHLVTDHHRARHQWPQPLPTQGHEPAAPDVSGADSERQFLNSWREELLERTWQSLAEANPPFHAVLLLRVENPELPSPQMAEQLTAKLGKAVNSAWVRKTLQRAHDKFADLLLEEVAQSLAEATPAVLRQELQELDLLRYCSSALERRGS